MLIKSTFLSINLSHHLYITSRNSVYLQYFSSTYCTKEDGSLFIENLNLPDYYEAPLDEFSNILLALGLIELTF